MEEAYGEAIDDLVFEVRRDLLPGAEDLEVGHSVSLSQETGPSMNVKVTAATEETVTLDANHALCGEDLLFNVELVSIDE